MTKKITKPSKKPLLQKALDEGLIQKWGETGLTDRQIAEQVGCSLTVLYEYKRENPQFAEALIRARMGTPVVNAWNGLVRLSTGYHEKTVKRHVKIKKDAQGNIIGREEEVIEDDVYVPPQPQACKSVLANFYHQALKLREGMPEEYIVEPIAIQQQVKNGRLTEMDEAMKQLFFGEHDNERE